MDGWGRTFDENFVEQTIGVPGSKDACRAKPQLETAKTANKRAAEASKLIKLAQSALEKAKEEDQAAALALATSGTGDEYQRHKEAADSARSIAKELQRRAYILENGTENNYRQLMLQQYGVNNPDLNDIAAYYAQKFSDQSTLNWLKLQRPAKRPRIDPNSLAMMGLFPEGEAAEEPSLDEGIEEESTFKKANKVEGTNTHENLVADRVTTPIQDLRAAGLKDAHHIIQDAAVRDLPGYNPNSAPESG